MNNTGNKTAMTGDLLPAEVLKTADKTEFTVIWLHGLGADGNDFMPIVPELRLPESLAIKFIFPHAPVRPVTLNNGYKMRAWFDILALEGTKTAIESDILTTVGWVTALIESEIENGVAPQKILVAGFSQGGVIAFHTVLRFPKRLAGIMALSTYIPFMENLLEQTDKEQSGLQVFAAHGQRDPVIPYTSFQEYVPSLETNGFNVEAHTYEMEHSVCQEEIQDMSSWLQKVLTSNSHQVVR